MRRKKTPQDRPKKRDDRRAAAKIFYLIGALILFWSCATGWAFRDGLKNDEGPGSSGWAAVKLAAKRGSAGLIVGGVFLLAGYNLANSRPE